MNDKGFPYSGEKEVLIKPTDDPQYKGSNRRLILNKQSPQRIEVQDVDLEQMIQKKGWKDALRIHPSPKSGSMRNVFDNNVDIHEAVEDPSFKNKRQTLDKGVKKYPEHKKEQEKHQTFIEDIVVPTANNNLRSPRDVISKRPKTSKNR